MKKAKQIPTLVGILILGIATILGVFLINKTQTFSLRATPQVSPEQVRITNISETSFSVSWTTQTTAKGFIIFGETSQLGQTALDDQDEGTETQKEYLIHHVTLKNLKPSTKYFFKINSGGKAFDNSGQPYEVTTAPTLNLSLPESDTAYGMILEPEGGPVKGVVVYLSLANTTPLSSLTKTDGTWMIPLSMARTINLANYSSYDKELQIEEIFVQGGNSGTITAITTTKNDNPVPSLTLGQNYDFRQTASLISPNSPSPTASFLIPTISQAPLPQASPTVTPKPTGFSLEPLISPGAPKLTILNPEEGETITSQKPEFIGAGPAGQLVEIKVESESSLVGQALIDQKGSWNWTPPSNLPTGTHTVTVTLKDENGLLQKVVRSFTVQAAGEGLPSFTATPSGQLSPQPTIIIGTPTPTPKPPKTGHLTTTLIFLIMGISALIFGFYQFRSI